MVRAAAAGAVMRTLVSKALVILLVTAGVLAGIVAGRGPVSGPRPVPTRTERQSSRVVAAQHRATSTRTSTSAQNHTRELVRDIEAALVSVDDRERARALRESLPKLMAAEPKAAAHILERAPRGPNRDEARDRIARLWAAADVDGALQWVSTLDDDDDRRLATVEIRSQIAASDPAAAIEISDLMDVGRNDGTLAHIAQLWAEENPSAAAAWVEKQPAGPLRDELLARIARVQAARRAAVSE